MNITAKYLKASAFTLVGSLCLIVGCARNDEAVSDSTATTRPTAMQTPATQPTDTGTASATTQPANSMLVIDNAQQWFPPARLRVSKSHGQIIARLYSDDPSGVLTGTGKEAINSFDLLMTLPDIQDPSQIDNATWVNRSSSMEKQDTPYGIFLGNPHAVLQPMDVSVHFKGEAPNIRLVIKGTFGQFRQSDDIANPAAQPVRVIGILDAMIPTEK